MKIKNLIFDFGGILIDLDWELYHRSLHELLQISIGDKAAEKKYRDIFLQYEVGGMNEEEFILQLQSSVDFVIDRNRILEAWNSILIYLPEERLNYLLDLRKEYNVYLLSNTNYTHIDWVHRDLEKRFSIKDFETRYFDHAYYSHDIHLRKPNTEIYKYIMNDAGINGMESLFIDDSLPNVEASNAAGLRSIRHDPADEIIERLPNYIHEVENSQ